MNRPKSKANRKKKAVQPKVKNKAHADNNVDAPADGPPRVAKELYFATQIYFFDFPDAKKFNQHLKRNIRKWRKNDAEGIVRSNMKSLGSWHSPVDMKTRPEYAEFCRRVIDIADTIDKDVGYRTDSIPVIDNMWANISPRYGFNRQHNHPGSLWSGVYYVHAPKDSGRLYFRDPRREAAMIQPQYEGGQRKREMWAEVYYEPIEGRIILFPAWLEHTVEPNLSKRQGSAGERISIAFNITQGFKAENGSENNT